VPVMSLRSRAGTPLLLAGLLICAGCGGGDPAPPSAGRPTPAASPSAGPSASPAVSPSPAASLSATIADATASDPAVTPSPAPVQALSTAAETCVQQAFGELSAAQRAGQLVMAGVPAGDPASYRRLVRTNRLGSVFLAGRTGDRPATIRKGVSALAAQRTRTTTIKLLVAVDQEGGKVQSLRGGVWTTIPTATTQGTWSTRKLTTRTRAWVRQLKSAGVNMNLAPVADTVPAGTEARNPPIGVFDRHYGTTSRTAARGVSTVTSTMLAGGVIPTIKHFPGLGRVRQNTDTSTSAVDRRTTVTSAYLKPFQAGIDAGAGAVMISSARYPKIDDDRLAVFSSAVISDLLRDRMKYQGVVMTDDVGRAVAVQSVPRGQRATRFIAAGGDLVLTVVPQYAATMVEAITEKAKSNSRFRAKVNASTLRVLRLKQESGLLSCS
jgi:beta-N-acetylhexosaminidase